MQQNRWFQVCLAGVMLGWGGLAAASGAAAQRQVIRMTLEKRPLDGKDRLGYGTCQWLFPTNSPREKLQALPQFKSSRPRWYAVQFGDAKDKVFAVALDESGGTGAGYDTVYVDSNNDNRIDAEKERHRFPLGTTSKADPVYLEFQIVTAGKTNAHFFHFTAFPYSDERHPQDIHANLRNGSYWVGRAVLNGVERQVVLADLDSNGLFNDPEQSLFDGDRFFVDFSGKTPSEQETQLSSFPYGEFTRIAGSWYSISAAPDGGQVTLAPASPHLGSVRAPPGISRATLRSPRQTLYLSFSNGVDQAIVGTYKLQSLSLREQKAGDKPLELSASYAERPPEVRIRDGKTFALKAGPPLRVEVQPRRMASAGTVGLSLVLVGSGGETYRWTRYANRSAAKPAFEVHDATGRVADTGTFEYG
jgi:hypothetical protein